MFCRVVFFLGQLGLEGTGEDDVTVIITLSIRSTEMAAISGALVVFSHATGCLPLKESRDGCEGQPLKRSSGHETH